MFAKDFIPGKLDFVNRLGQRENTILYLHLDRLLAHLYVHPLERPLFFVGLEARMFCCLWETRGLVNSAEAKLKSRWG